MFGSDNNLFNPQPLPYISEAPLQADNLPEFEKGGMFGGGGKFGIGQAIIAALNGYLASRGNPVGVSNLQMMQQMAEAKRQEAQYQHHRQDQNADWIGQQEYGAAHQQPTMTEKFAAEILDPNTPPDRRELLRSIVAQPPAPMTMTTPQGTYIGGRSEMPAAAGPPPGAVDMLRKNPALAPAFEQKYGPGSAAHILGAGGPSPGGSGGFL